MIKRINFSRTAIITSPIVLFFLLFLSSYTESKNNIIRVKLISSLPYFKDNKEFIYFRDSIGIVYYKNHILYEFPEVFSVQNGNGIINKELQHRYLLYNKNSFYGYYYDSLNVEVGKRIAVDSLLNKRAFLNQSLFNKSEDVLINSTKTDGNYNLIEKYQCKVKKDETYPDTTVVYYTTKMKEVEHSLSKTLDESEKMKVKKIRAIYNPQIIKGISIPSYEIMFELKEDNVTNLENYKRFIEKHQKEILK